MRATPFRTAFVAATIVGLSWSTRAAAQSDVESVGRLTAVQTRPYHMAHEIEISLVYLPYDAFYQGIGPEVSYTFHFDDRIAWEVIRGYYSFDLQTNLADHLATFPGNILQATTTDQMQYSLSSTLLWSPAYGKFALLNRAVAQGEAFLLLGGTLGKLTNSFKPGPTLGLGFRFFLSQLVSARFDFRYSPLFDLNTGAVTHLMTLSLGFSLDLGVDRVEAKD
jgi:outer membrane beta-barrel protein